MIVWVEYPQGQVPGAEGRAEHNLPALQSHLGDQSVARVQRDGAKLSNYYKQGGSVAVDSDAEDHNYRQGSSRLCRELRRH